MAAATRLERQLLQRASMFPPEKRDPEKGAALVVSLITLVGLLAIGGVTLLSVRSEISSAGASRYERNALYAAESGVASAMDFLRLNCKTNGGFFSDLVEPNNVNPQAPAGIVGNNRHPGQSGNLFDVDSEAWYQVTILNNLADVELALGNDKDGTVTIRSRGYAQNGTQALLEVEVFNGTCVEQFCNGEYAQENITARNDAAAICARAIDFAGGTRTLLPGGGP